MIINQDIVEALVPLLVWVVEGRKVGWKNVYVLFVLGEKSFN